ncbi:MAG: TatD family hydrolase [Clostridia bacterium]|nr:TatD family hydrolase [Clostridia bacterium]
MYFDAHTHLDDDKFLGEVSQVACRLVEAGVSGVVNAGCDLTSSVEGLMLAHTYPWCYATVGVHPHEASTVCEEVYPLLEMLAKDPRCVAVGEIGLDYHYDFSPREVQREVFIRQLELAHRLHLPVVLHLREAFGDTVEILNARRGLLTDGVLVHCYSGSAELARDFFNTLDAYYSFGGALTFAKHKEDVLSVIPRDRLLLETDAPYMTPVPHRGKRNEPALLPLTAAKMAEMLGMTLEEVAELTTANAKRLYRL